MYPKIKYKTTVISCYEAQDALSLEREIEIRFKNNEPMDATAPIIHTHHSEGVMPAYNIRSDRFELALDAINSQQKANTAKRENNPNETMQANKPETGGGNEGVISASNGSDGGE